MDGTSLLQPLLCENSACLVQRNTAPRQLTTFTEFLTIEVTSNSKRLCTRQRLGNTVRPATSARKQANNVSQDARAAKLELGLWPPYTLCPYDLRRKGNRAPKPVEQTINQECYALICS